MVHFISRRPVSGVRQVAGYAIMKEMAWMSTLPQLILEMILLMKMMMIM